MRVIKRLHPQAYLGLVRLRDQWFPGLHQPLITEELFEAAHRGHIPGRRRGKDILSGRVRCGLCHRLAYVDFNDRGQRLYRCKHRGRGCDIPGRSADGLQRAAALGLRLVGRDEELRHAIRRELSHHLDDPQETTAAQRRQRSITTLATKRRKLLDLHYEDKISPGAFAEEEARLTTQIEALQAEEAQVDAVHQKQSELAERFGEVAALLENMDLGAVWDAGTDAERRVLIEELIDAVVIYGDHLQVEVAGGPALNVALEEVGLRGPRYDFDRVGGVSATRSTCAPWHGHYVAA